jgi:hypothetical protein
MQNQAPNFLPLLPWAALTVPNTVGSAASARGGLHGTGFPGRAAKAAAADAGLGRSWVDAPPSGVGGPFF